jgi:hypothetical protein
MTACGKRCAMARVTTGTVTATENQNRREMSHSSGFSSSWSPGAATDTGSSAMPHLGQKPGPFCRIPGCMEHVKGRSDVALTC